LNGVRSPDKKARDITSKRRPALFVHTTGEGGGGGERKQWNLGRNEKKSLLPCKGEGVGTAGGAA